LLCYLIFRDPSDADASQRGLDHQIEVAEHHRPVDINAGALAAVFEIPSIGRARRSRTGSGCTGAAPDRAALVVSRAAALLGKQGVGQPALRRAFSYRLLDIEFPLDRLESLESPLSSIFSRP
jgi:hypothetical protein